MFYIVECGSCKLKSCVAYYVLDTDDLSVELITHDEIYEVYKQGYLFGNVKFYKNELYV